MDGQAQDQLRAYVISVRTMMMVMKTLPKTVTELEAAVVSYMVAEAVMTGVLLRHSPAIICKRSLTSNPIDRSGRPRRTQKQKRQQRVGKQREGKRQTENTQQDQ